MGLNNMQKDIQDKQKVVAEAQKALFDALQWYTLQTGELVELYELQSKENEF